MPWPSCRDDSDAGRADIARSELEADPLGPGDAEQGSEVTLYFWVIKVLCTTVGETGRRLPDDNLGLGLTSTTCIMSGVLVVALVFQFRRAYVPGVYWLAVVLISIVGTLITDNLTDNLGVRS